MSLVARFIIIIIIIIILFYFIFIIIIIITALKVESRRYFTEKVFIIQWKLMYRNSSHIWQTKP